MAINVGSNKPSAPTITIVSGTKTDGTDLAGTTLSTFESKDSNGDVTKQSVINVVGDLVLSITEDTTKGTAASYDTSADVVGKQSMAQGTAGTVGEVRQTFYTLNGKDPSRTKAYIWDGTNITLKANKSGSDNTIFKARTYVYGEVSDVARADFTISRTDTKTI